MERTLAIAKEYYRDYENFPKSWLASKCAQNISCAGSCNWGPEMALERII